MGITRPVEDRDADGLIALVGAVFDEYPGCVLDLPGLDADLLEPATTAARSGARWWVVEDDGRIVATIGAGPLTDDETVELKRLYVAASHRRRGLGAELIGRVEGQATGLGARRVVLWSDTRFADAHRLYDRAGYRDTGHRRQLHDPSDTTEIEFVKEVEPAAPRRTVRWDGPKGLEVCGLVDLPDGVLLRGRVEHVPHPRYGVEVDAGWRTRTVRVADDEWGTRWLTSDGAGRWWWDGEEVTELAGSLDVALEISPVTAALPLRRVGGDTTVRAAWVREESRCVEPIHQRYERLGDRRWCHRSAASTAVLTVDDDGLVVDYGDLWRRV